MAVPTMHAESPSTGASILLIEDDQALRCLLEEELRSIGYEVDGVPGVAEALVMMEQKDYGAVIMDKHRPGMSGLDVLPRLRRMRPDTPVVMISAFGDAPNIRYALEQGASAYLVKPFHLDEFRRLLQDLLDWRPGLEPAEAA
jgi:two-component system response regulator AtoC